MKAKLLIVDDDPDHCEFLAHRAERLGHDTEWTDSPHQALEMASKTAYDAVLTDLGMPEMSGLELCERMVGLRPDVPVIVVTGQGSLDAAIGAIRVGAYDFLTKPVDGEMLALGLQRALQHRRLKEEVRRLKAESVGAGQFGRLIGDSSAMRRITELIRRVGPSETSVLICGESGTGKELVARAVHEASARSDGPFVAVNCAAVPPTLIESELFGHVKGAFTDARQTRQGLFLEAHGGTVFLDEIGELPIEVQPKLLRALQERTVRPVGGSAETPFDARIVTATNRDLEDEITQKRFREDLYYRINVVRIDVPPLRERGSDILQLARHFVEEFAARSSKDVVGITEPAAEKLLAYSWPGNVRELENCIERAVALTQFNKVLVEDFPEKVRDYQADRFVLRADEPDELISMGELEKRYMLRVLSLVSGNKSRAAQILGMDRRTLYRKLERLEKAGELTSDALSSSKLPVNVGKGSIPPAG